MQAEHTIRSAVNFNTVHRYWPTLETLFKIQEYTEKFKNVLQLATLYLLYSPLHWYRYQFQADPTGRAVILKVFLQKICTLRTV